VSLTPAVESAGYVLLALSVCGAAYGAIATWALRRFIRRPAVPAVGRPSVAVLKPLHGEEPGLYENLESFCAQDYAGPLRLVLGVQNPADPALHVAERVKQAHADRDIVLVCDPATHGSNRKIGNLINMSGRADAEIVVISDSDVRLPPDGLSRIVGALEAPGVGLVHCLYRGRPTASLWSRLAAMDVNTRFAASVVVGEALGAHPCLGPTMALRADLLARIGGLPLLADQLADDFVLGAAVRAAGQTLACPSLVIDHVFPEASAREMLVHELRWARTIRLVQPAGNLGSVIVHYLPLALIGAALAGFSPPALAILATLAVFRLAQAQLLARLMQADRGLLWLTPLRDLISLGVFLWALTGDRVEWRGNRLKVGSDGAMAAS
jgi:ceramide glucosyltransferase